MAAKPSFTFFQFRKSTTEVVNASRNRIYDDLIESQRKREIIDAREQQLIKAGMEAKKKGQKAKFMEITRQIKVLQTERKGLSTRKATLERQLKPLEASKQRLDDIQTAKTITTANRRIMSEMGGMEGMLDLQQAMEQTTMEMEDGVGSVVDSLFEPEDGVSDEEVSLDDGEIDAIWADHIDDPTDGGGQVPVDELELRFNLLPRIPSSLPTQMMPAKADSFVVEETPMLVPVSEKRAPTGARRN